jgi:hypothetical protein
MFVVSEMEIIMAVLAVMAGVGIGLIFVLKRRKMVAIRKRCFIVAGRAKAEGLDLLAEIAESVATGDIVELFKEIESLEKMFMTPGALKLHLDELFTKQLALRLSSVADRIPILKAVDDLRANEQHVREGIIEDARKEEVIAAAGSH